MVVGYVATMVSCDIPTPSFRYAHKSANEEIFTYSVSSFCVVVLNLATGVALNRCVK